PVTHRSQAPAEAAPTFDRWRKLDPRLTSGEGFKMRRSPERPVETGRRDLQPVLVPNRILGIEHCADRATRPLAVLKTDPAAVGTVDVDPHHRLAPGRRELKLHELVAQTRDNRLEQAE